MGYGYDVRASALVLALARIAGRGRHAAGQGGSLTLSAGALRRRFSREFAPRPTIYWLDLLGSAMLGWTSFVVAASLPASSPVGLALTAVATLALYRGVLFLHELTHLNAGKLRGFEAAWSLLVGLPLMVPSLMYVGSHNEHHKRAVYGTIEDPEYAPMAHWSRLRIVLSVLTMPMVPGLAALRWGVLGPLSWLNRRFREEIVARASTLGINTHYRRRMPEGPARSRWLLGEPAAGLLFWAVVAGLWAGWISGAVLARWYLVGVALLAVNQLRTLAAHRYESQGGQLDDLGQLLDSVNVLGPPSLTALVAPVGLRYHALHHLLPSLPYHSLGAVHRALVAELAADSPYHRTESPGIWPSVVDLLERAHGHQRGRGQPAGRGLVRPSPDMRSSGHHVTTAGRFSREQGNRPAAGR